MNTTATPIRFFAVAYIDDIDSEFSGDHIDTVEITEGCFQDLMRQSGGTAPVQYDRHTVFDHGAAQVCLTLDLDQWPHADELDQVQAPVPTPPDNWSNAEMQDYHGE